MIYAGNSSHKNLNLLEPRMKQARVACICLYEKQFNHVIMFLKCIQTTVLTTQIYNDFLIISMNRILKDNASI